MNRVLAETLTALNGVIAIVIVLAGAFFGYRVSGGALSTVLIGAVLGLLIAALTCGLIAYLALIERHLAKIAGKSTPAFDGETSPRRRDPTL